MTTIERAQRYLQNCPSAISGSEGHKTTFSICCEIVNGFALDEASAFDLLQDWNSRCQPPWSERELRHKISEAVKAAHSKPRGHKLGNDRSNGSVSLGHDRRPSSAKAAPQPKPAKKVYDLNDAGELPDPIDDGARLLIKTVFSQGEGIRIVNATLNEEDKEIPDGSGPCLSREEWLRKLDDVKGKPNSLFHSTKKTGIYIGVNPMKIGGSKDSDVTSFRHALFEFDEGLSVEEQFSLYQKSRLPCAAVIYSGGKSVHAWVKIDAQDRREYDDRLKQLYDHFESSGYKFDAKNKNPSRFSRLPHCVRFESRQELLSLAMGCESFSEWSAEIQAESMGQLITVDDIDDYDPKSDNSLLVGNDWLCRGEPAILNGASGIGKSSLVYQMALAWAVGRPMFGIKPVKALRVLVVQAENSKRYLKKVLLGLREGIGLNSFNNEEEWDLHRSNFIFVHEATHTKLAFIDILKRRIEKHKCDLVVIDPLLAYCPEISKIEVCSQFCREWTQPILDSTKTAALFVHHTGKTSTDAKSRKGWNLTDFSYAGLGSSDLPNWVRASMTLDQVGDGGFRLMFTKRTWEAGATHPGGIPTNTVWLRHAPTGIFWVQIEAPEEKERGSGDRPKGGAPSKIEKLFTLGIGPIIDKLTSPISKNELAKLILEYADKHHVAVEISSCKKAVDKLFENKSVKKEGGKYAKA